MASLGGNDKENLEIKKKEILLEVADLTVEFGEPEKSFRVIDGASFHIGRGETLGLVGESGSGKSMVCLALLQLVPKGGRITAGKVLFDGRDLLALNRRQMRSVRGAKISMILQDPMTSLNPVLSVGDQVMEPIRLHQGLSGNAALQQAISALSMVRIPSPEDRIKDYPHQLSGGMRQRVSGAIALSCEPDLLIADEPTTALDVTIQADYLALLSEIQASTGISIIMVTHDFGVIAESCHRVAVMYSGQIVESGHVEEIFDRPGHPYTRALLGAMPTATDRRARLETIEGQPPSPRDERLPCPFEPRCKHAMDLCREERPPAFYLTDGHWAACWLNANV